jgi:hypothetical protein
MTTEQEHDTLELLERLNGATSFLRSIAWAMGGLAVAGVSVAGWVWTVNAVQNDHTQDLLELKPRVASLEVQQARRDSIVIPSLTQIHDLDKRLARIEDKFQAITEQNAMMIELLRKHDPK